MRTRGAFTVTRHSVPPLPYEDGPSPSEGRLVTPHQLGSTGSYETGQRSTLSTVDVPPGWQWILVLYNAFIGIITGWGSKSLSVPKLVSLLYSDDLTGIFWVTRALGTDQNFWKWLLLTIFGCRLTSLSLLPSTWFFCYLGPTTIYFHAFVWSVMF